MPETIEEIKEEITRVNKLSKRTNIFTIGGAIVTLLALGYKLCCKSVIDEDERLLRKKEAEDWLNNLPKVENEHGWHLYKRVINKTMKTTTYLLLFYI